MKERRLARDRMLGGIDNARLSSVSTIINGEHAGARKRRIARVHSPPRWLYDDYKRWINDVVNAAKPFANCPPVRRVVRSFLRRNANGRL